MLASRRRSRAPVGPLDRAAFPGQPRRGRRLRCAQRSRRERSSADSLGPSIGAKGQPGGGRRQRRAGDTACGRVGVRWALREDGTYGTDGTNVKRPMAQAACGILRCRTATPIRAHADTPLRPVALSPFRRFSASPLTPFLFIPLAKCCRIPSSRQK